MILKSIIVCKYPLKLDYYVSDTGHVYSLTSNKFISEVIDRDGYHKVRLATLDDPKKASKHLFSVHRLVAENFMPIENMAEMQINHKDGNKDNNALDNLEWCTCKENINHAIKNGLRAKVNGSAKLTEEQVIEIYKRTNSGERVCDIAREYNMNEEAIRNIKYKRLWKRTINEYLNKGSTTIA